MSREIIATEKAPAAIGTYSQAVKVGKTVYLSGQIPLVPETMELVDGDMEAQIEQVFSNLIENAQHHGADCVSVDISDASNGATRITVQDNGRGISKGNEERVFDLFFTTRRDSGGTGMGLGIVRSMLNAHKGTIALTSSSDAKEVQGARFQINIPKR